MSLSILVADSLHINKKNFSSFFKFIEKFNHKIYFEDSHKDWIALYGVYDSKIKELFEKINILSKLPERDLKEFKINDINVFSICRAEILTLVAVQPEWYESAYPKTSSEIFDTLFKRNKNILLQNMAAAWYWLEFWKTRLSELPAFTHCCVFSGGLIYQKSLIEQLKYTPVKVMVMESLFTGNEYYCEERYSAIANNCDIKHTAIYQSYLNSLEDGNLYDKERTKAINKFINAKNKNVQQPDYSELLEFENNNLPIVSIIGQVVNDFSVLEYKNTGISTIYFYKELIIKLAENNFNVIMKTHPWEEKKNNIRSSLTKNVLTDFIDTLPCAIRNRIKLVDHYSIKQLFSQSDWIVGLNSQGLLEAAFEGFKPVQFGNAFYGRKGFTSDYDLDQIDNFISDIRKKEIYSTLSIEEFNLFEQFITILLQKHTVSIYDSGIPVLQKIFALPSIISLSSVKKISSAPKQEQKKHDIKSNIPVKSISNSSAPSNSPTTTINGTIHNNVYSNKKLIKLKNDPRKFFSDSRNPFIRPLRHLFKPK